MAHRETRFILIPVLGDTKTFVCSEKDRLRNYDWLTSNIREHFDEDFEHVAVLYKGQRRDMFVGATSSINGRHIRNVRATAIYRNNTLTHSPGTDPESLPAISGPVVLFPDTIVWK